MDKAELEKRTKAFAVRTIRFVADLPKTQIANVLGYQLLRAATSVGANYREANRAESRADFTHKIALVEKEASECRYWLELLDETLQGDAAERQALLQEPGELLAIFTAIGKTTKANSRIAKFEMRNSQSALPNPIRTPKSKMTNIALRVENLGKRYRIGARQQRYGRFTETLMDTLTTPIRRLSDLRNPKSAIRNPNSEMIWALRDVSFEVQRGEAVGIIGRNGAGKSTLLKILSRITAPTAGRAEIHGRVGSLLEVGTGFHPELTGRENIYLNGAILGMKRAEIERKFDEIVAFAEIEQFLDTPVKHYSSGMYVRLAFAVAAHLEPEILLVDEVLAVGDAQFQKKCLGKMEDVAKGGRTVLFVSHNMAAVENLCNRAIWLDEGRTRKGGSTGQVIADYMNTYLTNDAAVDLESFRGRSGTGEIRIVQIEFFNRANQRYSTVRMGESLTIRFTIRPEACRRQVTLGVYLYTANGTFVSTFRTSHTGFDSGTITAETSFDLIIDPVLLYPQTYMITPWVADSYGKRMDYIKYAAKFTVEDSDFLGTGAHFDPSRGITYILSHWRRVRPL